MYIANGYVFSLSALFEICMMLLTILLIAIFLSDISVAVIYYVKPDYGDNISNCSYQHCYDLNYYANIFLDHYSALHFLSGEFILSSDLIIRDVHNISLIGSKDDNSVVNTIIHCNSSFSVIMSNVTGLTVRNILIRNCGPSEVEDENIIMMRTYNNTHGKHAVIVNYCASVLLEELTIITSKNPGLLAVNVIGNYSMVNITVNKFIFLYDSGNTDEHSDCLEINTYSCTDNVAIFCKMIFHFSQENLQINITISNVIFSYYKAFKLISIISNVHFKYMIHIKHSSFIHNQINAILSASVESTYYGVIKFCDCIFYNNSMLDSDYLISANILHSVSWTDCIFNKNDNLTLFVPNFQVTDVIFKNTTFSSSVWGASLINIFVANFIFYGPVKFINITGNNYLFNVLTGTFTCYNYIGILHNRVKGFLHSYYRTTISLEENTALEVKYNVFSGYFAISSQLANKPYPNCLFQYYSSFKENYDKIWYQGKKLIMNYSISFIDNYMEPLPYSYVAECDWSLSSDVKEVIPLEINEHIIEYKNRWHMPLLSANERDICVCETISTFNCNTYKLGPIYPGETLITKLAISHHWNSVIYEEFDIIWNRETTCQYDGITKFNFFLIHTGHHRCSISNLTILATQEKWCTLVLYNNESIDSNPAVFYVMLYPGCPMGFVKYSNKCDCDKVLGILFTFTCNINDRTILRPSNSWINATTNNYYIHNYMICQVCPFDYCLPQPSHLHLSHPNSQCQFNRSGLLCGQCQQGLSTVFGSSECEHCSNVYLLLSLLFAVLGILLVFMLFTINVTVTDGTINGFVFYVNIVSVNDTIFFQFHQFSYVFISIANLDLGIKTCFYSGMDNYAKMWLQLAFPIYLILIAASLIIASRYSTRIQRLTARRALPVLATLFLVSYTKILRTTCNVLFLYSRVIYLPSNKTKLMWSVDANVPLFEAKFIILFITCLALFFIMIPFNTLLIFTRFFMRFRLVSKFKPLIDAYQGAYKDNCYYWIGMQLVIRAVFLGLSSLDRTMNLTIGIILISILIGVHGLLRPFKNEFKNYQEFIWLINLQVLHVLSFNKTNMVYVNILVIITLLYFSIVTIYHVMTYTWIGKILRTNILSGCSWIFTLLSKLVKPYKSENTSVVVGARRKNEIPDVTYNYHELREPLAEL